MRPSITIFSFCCFLLLGCKEQKPKQLFTALDPEKTGIKFNNQLFDDQGMSVLNYSYYYNGGGVAVGDVNNDGLTDIFFTGNMVKNRLYLNKGNFTFENITDKAGVALQQGWCTGASMIDINGDGKLDIYICRSAATNPALRRNLLYINNGDLTFSEQGAAYGLADDGYSTQASFFDYDKDGDLDCFLINHSLQQYTTGAIENPGWRKEHKKSFECKLFQNNFDSVSHHAYYTDVSEKAGIHSNVLTFGLGVAVTDLNKDGWPDVYVSNDFNEADYFFINNGNGSFTEALRERMDAASLYSMGSDAADINNDGLPDLITMDMLPSDNALQKTHMGAENFDKFQLLFGIGFYNQYSRNMLHLNNGDGSFSEIGQLAGISATDWSWAPLFCDFDNDGNKDLLTTTGYVKDYTDMDFVKYSADVAVKQRAGDRSETVKTYIDKMPESRTLSALFRNEGNLHFTRKNTDWGLLHKTTSAGAAYADFDNDGYMDIIISNTNDIADIYRNNGKALGNQHFIKCRFKGVSANPTGIGAKVQAYVGGKIFYQEQVLVRGYQSSVDPLLNMGLGPATKIDSLLVIWPDDSFQWLKNLGVDSTVLLDKAMAASKWNYQAILVRPLFSIKDSVVFKHQENKFNDFSSQGLLPNFLSRPGPCVAKADLNGDHLDDIFVGGAAGQPGAIFLQNANGNWRQLPQPALDKDKQAEDAKAVFFDADGDGDQDLVVGAGGYEFNAQDPLLQLRLYINNGKGVLTAANAFLLLPVAVGALAVGDVDNDGDMDMFVGGRLTPGRYPETPTSYFLLNDGKGRFSIARGKANPFAADPGMVTAAALVDLNNDQRLDLVVAGEWMRVRTILNTNSGWQETPLAGLPDEGWWNCLYADDLNGDGYVDLVLGNQGVNNQFQASEKEPLELYYADFDGNGSIDPLFCYYLNGTSYPAANRDDLTEQLPGLRKQFNSYSSYSTATIADFFPPEKISAAGHLYIRELHSMVLLNQQGKTFKRMELPVEAQFAPVYAIVADDVNHDGKKDLVLAGNNSWTRIKFGRYRANHGLVLTGDGIGAFAALPQAVSNLRLRGDVRSLTLIKNPTGNQLLVGFNDGPLVSYH